MEPTIRWKVNVWPGEPDELQSLCLPHSRLTLWLAAKVAVVLRRWDEFWALVNLFRGKGADE